MIQLVRMRGETVPKGLTGGPLMEKSLQLLSQAAQKKFSFNSAYWKSGKKQLKAESCGKCAYCEAPTTVVAHGDVEHFRPKKIYWWLAYCYENHLFACQICNQIYKSDKFPIAGRRMSAPRLPAGRTKSSLRALASRLGPDSAGKSAALAIRQFQERAHAEKALLIDPYLFNPEKFLAWEADDDLKEVRLVARKSQWSRQVAHAAETCLGLNREELRRVRYRTFHKLDTYRRVLVARVSKELRQRTEAEICDMASREAEFAAMTRFFIKKWKLQLGNNEA